LIAARGLSSRSLRIDGEEVADLGDVFVAGGYLLHGLLLLLGMDLAPDIGYPFVYLDVQVRYVHGARILADPRPDAVLDLFLLFGDVANASPVPPADERARGRVGVFTLGPGPVRVLRPLML
jgi:hypothetical protein